MGKWTDYMEGGSQSINNADQWLPEEEEKNIVSGGNFTPGSYVPEGAVNNYQPAPVEPEWDPESGLPAPRAWDIHYKPSWFVEEQTNRKNPMYTPDENWSNEEVDAIANYVSGMKKNHPDEWKYGDPGWDTSTQLWRDKIKPLEDQYATVQKKKQEEERIAKHQLQANQPQAGQDSQYYAFHNNNVQTFAPNEDGVLSQDQIDAIKANSPYRLHNVDTTGADYESLSRSGKANFNFMPATAGTDVKNRKWYQRFSQPVLGAVMSASGPATIAKLLFTALGGPVGWAYGATWAATAGYSYAKGANLIKGNDKIDKFIELTDLPDEKMAQFQGKLAYAFEKAGGGDWTDWSKSEENLDFLVKNFDTIWYYAFGEGKASNEYNSDVVDIVSGLTPNMGANVIGVEGQGASRFVRNVLSQVIDNPEDKIWLERNQTTRSNSGLAGVYEIPEELLGTNAITYWLNYGQYLYDHGVTNPKQLEYEIGNAINEVYGDLANYSEFIEHELGDPGNAMEGMQARGLAVVGDVTGDVNLANAARANTGNFAMDLAGQVPGLQGLIETVGRLTGNEIRSSGGIDEVINTWNMENLQSDPSTLTARDRRISGINEDGSLKALTPLTNPNEIKNPFLRGAEKIKQLFRTTNEFRATMAGDSIMNFISTGIEDAMTARPGESEQARIERATKFVDELANPETISENSPFSKPSKTILFNSIKEDVAQAVRSRRAEIDKLIQDYAKLTPNRQVLYTLSEALGLTPDKLLKKYQDEKTDLAQMIINKADQNGGVIPEIKFDNGTPIPVDSRAFGDLVMSMISPFVGKDSKPYDHRALLLQISSKISDGVTDTLINKYHIEPEGWVYRFGDTIKKLQHLWLLGLSPSYLANNVVNNVLTRSALGYGGFLTPNAINDWTKRFGFTPERFNESMAEGILETSTGKKSRDQKSSSEKMREAIRAKRKQGNKFFNKIDSKLDWVSDHMGFFGAISGKIEEMESRQIYTSAMMTYMARTWKPGVNFRKMPVELENKIREQNPEMVDAIYSAVSGGVNMKEIENAIYGTYVIPNVRETLVDAARNLGITDAEDAIIEIFDKGGIFAELQKALEGKRGDEIDAVIQKVIERAKAIANIQLAEDIARRAEQVANDTANYGFAEAVKLGQDMADNMADLWIKSQDANTQLFNQRVRDNMKTAEFRKLYTDHQKALNERWAGVYATVQQNYLGILNGLGFTDETTKNYTDQMKQRDGLWVNFYQKTQPEAIQPYLDALVWRTDDDFEKWDSRVRKAWSDYTKDIKQKYDDTVKAEQKLQIQMDKTFADGFKATLDKRNKAKVDANIVPLQEDIRNKRQEIVNKNRELRSIADNTNVLNEKNQVYKEAQAERQQLVNDYRKLQKQLYEEIRALGPQTVASAQNSATATPNPAADIRTDAMRRRAEQAQSEAEQIAESTVDDVAGNEDIHITEATTLEQLREEQRRRNLENSPEFKEWHGDHPENFNPDGSALTVWHGSDNVFAEFSKDFLGSNTESKSAEMGFFFSKNRKTAASYLTDEIDLDTYYQDELYKKIYDAPEATNWTSVKSDDEVQAIKNRVSDVIEKINKTFPELKDRAENNWLTYQLGITEDGVNKISGENTQALHLRNRLDAIEKLLVDSDTIRKGIEETIEAKKERDNSARGDLRDPNLNVRQFYLSFDNPLVHDFEGKDWRNVSYAEVIQKAIDNGNDAVILKNTYDGGPMDTIYVVFDKDQIRSVYYGKNDSNTINNDIPHLTPEQVNEQFDLGKPVNLTDVDLSTIQGVGDRGAFLDQIATRLYEAEVADAERNGFQLRHDISDYMRYVEGLVTGEQTLDDETNARIWVNLQKYDKDGTFQKDLENIKNNLYLSGSVPETGNYVVQAYNFSFGRNTIAGAVFHDGKLAAYIPTEMGMTSVDLFNGESVQVLGVSPENPDQWVYLDGDDVFTAPKQEVKKENPMTGDAETDSLGALDPGPQANHEMTYDTVVPVLEEFVNLYKNALNDAMANKTFGSLDARTKEMVRQYIDNDVRTDLMNTKYKTGKFGEMMRDSALLNYSKRYGFDNAMTLLFPYQFWNTRSMWNWINRMGGKGGKMWRRYARLKELEERNKKELLPSRITGKIGIYLPFLPDWMGDALFMPTSQLSIVGNFMDPLDDWLTDNKAVTATAERYVQEAFDANDITLEEYQTAMDPTKRNGSAVWQEMFARAQTDGDHDRDLGSLFKQYFGMSLPVSVGKALLTDNPEGWTQTPMTRTGTAFRAIFGGDLGKGLEFAMSAPERAMRKAAVAITGNNDFRYQEFGSWGDYYIRNQVWDMVVEGRISAEQAMEACGQKDGNKIWEQAADRQRQELLQKTQLLSATMPFKKMVEDVKNGNQDKLGDDFKYLLAEILTMWTPTSVVRDAERTWRADKAEMNKLYDTGTKDDRSKFYDDHPYYTYNNLRYEDDTEQALRSYLYKSIMDKWYDLSDTEKDELKMAFGTDFQRSILSEETRAYQTMDIDQLSAYAQAMNGSIPYLATDSLNTTNVPRINTNVVPQAQKSAQETYLQEREKQFPGMADVSNIYYKLPVEDRKIFRQMNPDLDRYWQWNRQYKDAHPDVKDFQNRRTDYYNTLNAENVFSMLDPFTIKELNRAAWTKDKVRKEYQTTIERAMFNAGITDKYDDFVKVLTNYILGE